MFKLGINNFRGYKEEIFDFKRINILIGENSGGKSSLIKFILAMKQTIESPNLSNLILNGKHTDLGSYKDAIYNRDDSRSLEFSFSFNNELRHYFKYFMDELMKGKKKKIEKIIAQALEHETTSHFKINNDLSNHKSIKSYFKNDFLGQLDIVFNAEQSSEKGIIENEHYESILKDRNCNIRYKSFTRNKTFTFRNIDFSKKGFLTIIDTVTFRKACEKFNDDTLFFECGLFLLNQNLIEFKLDEIKYLNPLDSAQKRIYINRDSQSEYEKSDLEKFANMMNTKQISKETISKFDMILREYGIVDGIKSISSKSLPVTELRVKIKNLVSNICDVGYGVSLQIPIIFEALIAEEEGGRTFIIEQPEVHLHPKLQSKFIETLLKLGNENKYIIETHSEHIVRMLQVMTKYDDYDLNNSEINILYFSRGDDQFSISNHTLCENGQMEKPFPSGFYDNSYLLTKKLMF